MQISKHDLLVVCQCIVALWQKFLNLFFWEQFLGLFF